MMVGKKGRRVRRDLVTVAGLLCIAPAAVADVVVIGASKDNTLFQSPTGLISNGSGPHMYVGANRSSNIRRGVLAFDLAGAVPDGATINSVTLTLFMSRTVSGGEPVALHRLLADWGEGSSNSGDPGGFGAPAAAGDATWIHRFSPEVLWSSPGGDFSSEPSATLSVGDVGSYTWGTTPAMVADVQLWLDDPASNFGWILIGNEASSGSAKRFSTRQNSTASQRPRLTIDFTLAMPQWLVDADADWGAANNWSGGVPNAAGAAANFLGSITAPRTIAVGETYTVGSIQFDNDNAYTLAGGGGLALETVPGGTASIDVIRGSHIIDLPLEVHSDTTITLAPSAALTLQQPVSAPEATLTKTGQGTLSAAHLSAGSLSLQEGLLHLLSDAPAANFAGSLSIEADPTPAATLDLDNNSLVVGAGDLAEIEALIASGRNGGAWDGPGITSSSSAASPITGLAVILNATPSGAPIFTEFEGRSVDAESILILQTFNGDMDLNRIVDIDDYFLIDTGFLAFQAGAITEPTYRQGDLNFDDLVDIDDYFLIDTAFLGQSAPALALRASATPIPEPATLPLLALTSLNLLRRIRRRLK